MSLSLRFLQGFPTQDSDVPVRAGVFALRGVRGEGVEGGWLIPWATSSCPKLHLLCMS